jgi:hypothetical protein
MPCVNFLTDRSSGISFTRKINAPLISPIWHLRNSLSLFEMKCERANIPDRLQRCRYALARLSIAASRQG